MLKLESGATSIAHYLNNGKAWVKSSTMCPWSKNHKPETFWSNFVRLLGVGMCSRITVVRREGFRIENLAPTIIVALPQFSDEYLCKTKVSKYAPCLKSTDIPNFVSLVFQVWNSCQLLIFNRTAENDESPPIYFTGKSIPFVVIMSQSKPGFHWRLKSCAQSTDHTDPSVSPIFLFCGQASG